MSLILPTSSRAPRGRSYVTDFCASPTLRLPYHHATPTPTTAPTAAITAATAPIPVQVSIVPPFARGRHRGQHRMNIHGIPGTPDPRNQAVSLDYAGVGWPRVESNHRAQLRRLPLYPLSYGAVPSKRSPGLRPLQARRTSS